MYADRSILDELKHKIVKAVYMEQDNSDFFHSGGINKLHVYAISNRITIATEPLVSPRVTEDLGSYERFLTTLSYLALELKKMMIDDTYGAWFGFTIEFDNVNDTYLFTFDYDTYVEFYEEVPDSAFIEELTLYPRTQSAIPDWLEQRLGDTLPAQNVPSAFDVDDDWDI